MIEKTERYVDLVVKLPDGEYVVNHPQSGKQAIIVVKGGKVKALPEDVDVIRAGYPA